MSPEQTRRKFLAIAAGVGIAGCSVERSNVPPVGRDQTTPTSAETPHDETQESLYSGDTIPPVQHPDSRAPPLIAGPYPDVDNPILTASDVTDFGDVTFVADPFLFIEENDWYLFFEVYNENRNRPDAPIAYAHSHDGREWAYQGICLEKQYHTSFPLIWKWEDEYYMCPPTGKDIELWRARSFPDDWEFLGNIVDADYYPHDPAIFRYDDRWWAVADQGYTDVMVYYSDELESLGWTPHPENPVVTDRIDAARPGGRPVVIGDSPYLFFQDLADEYGDKIRAYEVVDLSPTTYRDREVPESPVLAESGIGWNAEAMHTFDPWWVGDGWVSAVDGEVNGEWSIGLYYTPGDVTVATGQVPYDRSFTDGYYQFGAHESVTVDHSGNGHSGAIFDCTPLTRDGLDGLTFDADSSRVVFPCSYDSAIGSSEFTIVTYAQSNGEGQSTLLEYGKPGGEYHLGIQQNSGQSWTVSARGDGGTSEFSTNTPSLASATQVAVTYSHGGGLELLVGSSLQGRGDDPGQIADSRYYLVVGSDVQGNTPWNGWIGPTGVFTTALSERELEDMDAEIRRK